MVPDDACANPFDGVSDLYDRVRPPYPDALFDDVIAFVGLGADARLLEIGAGTGIATLPFARRGFRIECIEPGPRLAARIRAKTSGLPQVRVAETTFERWPDAPGAFDLVYAAQSFHWLDPGVRFDKAVRALVPTGALAVFGHAPCVDDSPLRRAIDAAYARHAPELRGVEPMRWYAQEGPLPALFAAARGFGPVAVRRYPWTRRDSTESWLDLLRTFSDHVALPEPKRRALLDAIGGVIEAFGGSIETRYETHLYLARPIPR